MRKTPGSHTRLLLWTIAVLLLSGAAQSDATDLPRNNVQGLQVIVDDMVRSLALPATVTASVVPTNSLLVSVEPREGEKGTFVLSFEASFYALLNDDELRAVIAHELGHVWIFTHHPYLHTERLANSVAMRIVSRESLEKVYEKMWNRLGTKGDLVQFLGQ